MWRNASSCCVSAISARIPIDESATASRCDASPDDAAKPDVAGPGVDRVVHPGRRSVAPTVVRGAEVRATLDHFPRDRQRGDAGVDAAVAVAASRVDDRAAAAAVVDLEPLAVPVARPLPDVADRVVETE